MKSLIKTKMIEKEYIKYLKKKLTDRKFDNFLNKEKYSKITKWYEYGYINCMKDVILELESKRCYEIIKEIKKRELLK